MPLTNQGNYEWVHVYTQFANKLLEFRNNRPALIEKIKNTFGRIGMKLPTLEDENLELTDICPFTVMGLFNKNLTKSNRKIILTNLLRALNIPLDSPSSFDGIPILNPKKSTFYWFIGRSKEDIPNLWKMFESAIRYADVPTAENRKQFLYFFDTCQKQKGVKWNLTMGLFWIRPNTYLNLDERNRWYIEKSHDLSILSDKIKGKSSKVPNAEEYLNITKQVRKVIESSGKYQNFVDFSYWAWLESEKVNKEKKQGIKQIQLTHENGVYHVDIDITVEEWKEMLMNKEIFYSDAFNMVLEWYKHPRCQASSKEITDITHPDYKGTPYNNIVCNLGKRIIKHLKRFEVKSTEGKPTYWCIPFEGWYGSNGRFIWKVRNELAQAISELQLVKGTEVDIKPVLKAAEITVEPYTEVDFLHEVYIPEHKYRALKSKLLLKKNIILQGAPGVGKTYSAKRLAYAIMGCKDEERIMMVQFHQTYSYEDFMMGYRPNGAEFVLKYGPFYKFCKKAARDSNNPYFFIIDEINRGNLSKIFGELFMLMESGYRDYPMQLLYTDEEFSIPKNLYIIGMMNTADRSLAMLDYALRRRFAFFELEPAFQSSGFIRMQQQIGKQKFDRLIKMVEELNTEIYRDDSLGKGFRIGHSYFCTEEMLTDEQLESIVYHELIPLLEEYWFDDQSKVDIWTQNLIYSIQ